MFEWLSLILSVFIEISSVYLFLVSGKLTILVISLHLISAGIVVIALKNKFFAYLSSVITLTLPGIGILGITLVFFLTRIFYNKNKTLYKEYLNYVTADIFKKKKVVLIEDKTEFFRQSMDILSYNDHLRYSDTDMRIKAVQISAKLKDKQSAKTLILGANDFHPDVRIYATREISKIIRNYQDEISQAKDEVKENAGLPEAHNMLANLSLNYYESGLIGDTAKEEYLKLAEDEYLCSLSLSANQTDVLNQLGQIYLLKGIPKEALVWFKKSLDCDPDNVRARIGILDCYWNNRDYHLIPVEIKNNFADKVEPYNDIITFWK